MLNFWPKIQKSGFVWAPHRDNWRGSLRGPKLIIPHNYPTRITFLSNFRTMLSLFVFVTPLPTSALSLHSFSVFCWSHAITSQKNYLDQNIALPPLPGIATTTSHHITPDQYGSIQHHDAAILLRCLCCLWIAVPSPSISTWGRARATYSSCPRNSSSQTRNLFQTATFVYCATIMLAWSGWGSSARPPRTRFFVRHACQDVSES